MSALHIILWWNIDCLKKHPLWDFPGSLVVRTPELILQVAWVWSLIGDLRSLKLQVQPNKQNIQYECMVRNWQSTSSQNKVWTAAKPPLYPLHLASSVLHPVPSSKGEHVRLVTQSCLTLSILWTIIRQAPLSMEFSRKEQWSGLPFPPPGDLLDPEVEPTSPVSLALQVASLPAEALGKPHSHSKGNHYQINVCTCTFLKQICLYAFINIKTCVYFFW